MATRVGTTPARAPARVVTLDADDARAAGATSAADLLEARAPVQLRRYGPGGLASLSVRGGAAGHATILLDGHALTDPQLGQTDLALLPTSLIARLELLHGAGSALHGAGALAGVVALSTPAPAAIATATLETRAGAWGDRSLGGLASFNAGALGVVLAASGETARDDYPYFDPNAGIDGGVVRRLGADRVLGSLYARVVSRGRLQASAALWAGAAERGSPGAAGTASEQGGRQWDRHIRSWGELSAPAGIGSVRIGALVQRASLRFAGAASADTGRTWLASGNAEWLTVRERWSLVAGMQTALTSATHPSLSARAREGRLSGWTAGTGRIGRVLLYPALRADGYLRPGAPALVALSPRLGANIEVAPWLSVKTSAGTAFRPPTFNDRFWHYAGRAAPAGDPDLRPERGWTADAGVHGAHGRLTAEATAFVAGARDQIVWLPAEDGFYVPGNVSRTRTRGAELTVDLDAISIGGVRLGAGAAYAFTDARDWSTPGGAGYGRPLRYVARHVGTGRLGVGRDIGATTVRVDLHGRVLGRRPTRADGGAPLPAHVVLDAQVRVSRPVARAGVEIGLAIENLTNTGYAVIEGYPMPPRHGRLTLRLTF